MGFRATLPLLQTLDTFRLLYDREFVLRYHMMLVEY